MKISSFLPNSLEKNRMRQVNERFLVSTLPSLFFSFQCNLLAKEKRSSQMKETSGAKVKRNERKLLATVINDKRRDTLNRTDKSRQV